MIRHTLHAQSTVPGIKTTSKVSSLALAAALAACHYFCSTPCRLISLAHSWHYICAYLDLRSLTHLYTLCKDSATAAGIYLRTYSALSAHRFVCISGQIFRVCLLYRSHNNQPSIILVRRYVHFFPFGFYKRGCGKPRACGFT